MEELQCVNAGRDVNLVKIGNKEVHEKFEVEKRGKEDSTTTVFIIQEIRVSRHSKISKKNTPPPK